MQKYDFGQGRWDPSALLTAYSFRFTETPVFTQNSDHIAGGPNPAHREGFDNISLLYPSGSGAGSRAALRCSFEGTGCPEIILVERPEQCEDGAMRYGACFEIVLYRDGVSVWRHYCDDGKCSWHKRLGVHFPVAEKEIHELAAEVQDQMLVISVDGRKIELRVEDMFQSFHIGVTACEGTVRLYSLQIEPA